MAGRRGFLPFSARMRPRPNVFRSVVPQPHTVERLAAADGKGRRENAMNSPQKCPKLIELLVP